MNTENQQATQENQVQGRIAKQKYLAYIFRWVNAGCGITLIVNGVLRYIFFITLISEPWTFFQPAYMILFGLLIAGSELNIVMVLSRVSFMHSYIGRGVLDIFVATICSSYYGGDGINIISIILSIALFITGLMYLCFHFSGFELIIPQQTIDEINQKKASVSTQNNNDSSNLDNSQNLGRHLSDPSDPTSSIYHTHQI